MYDFHLLMLCIFPSWFDKQEHVLRMRTFQSEANCWQKLKLMLQGYNESTFKVVISKFYGRYNNIVCYYKLSLADMLNDLFHTFC
jgi:hypothetical protein